VGTEFGLFFSPDGGGGWIQLKGGMPTIAVRDLEIQRRENDLVAASFGRGFYILDDYSPLRGLSEAQLDSEAILFPVKTTWTYIVSSPMGGGPKASQGDGFYVAPNPPFGAVLTYYLKEGLQTRHQKRKSDERQAVKQGEDVGYPSWDELREEDRQQAPSVFLTVSDPAGNVVRRLEAPRSAGFHRLAWDLRHPAARRGGRRSASGPLAVPGRYQVQLSRMVDGVTQQLSQPERFEVVPLGNATLPAADAALRLEFEERVAELQAAVLAAGSLMAESLEDLGRIRAALLEAGTEVGPLLSRAEAIRLSLMDLQERLDGDETRRRRAEFVAPAVEDRVQRIVRALWASTADATQTHRRSYQVAADEFQEVYATLRLLLQSELADLHRDLDRAGVRWTPGRPLPEWPRR
ncbi:MAG: glycosyl hydrolase, partial [Acidobacteriota bacterium]